MKRKVLLALSLLVIIMVLLATSVSADELVEEFNIAQSGKVTATIYFTDEGEFSLVVSGTGLMKRADNTNLVNYKETLASVVIEDGIQNIPANMFDQYKGIKSVTIGATVRSIGAYAFRNCTSLVSVNLPKSLEKIDMWAFMGCVSLRELYMPDSVKNLGNAVFKGCTALERVQLSASLTAVAAETFSGCRALREVTIPNSVTQILGAAFHSCTSLEAIVIPESVTQISSQAFYGCTSLKELTIPISVQVIQSGAFQGCTSVTFFILSAPVEVFPEGWVTNWNPHKREVVFIGRAHSYEETIIVEPTHNSYGEAKYTCTECGDSYTGVLPKENHSYASKIVKPATHFEQGEKKYYCECGDSYTVAISIIPHDYKVEIVDATHLEEGARIYTCECGDSYTEVIPKIPHEYTETILKKATHFERGTKRLTCDCGDFYEETIPMVPHLYEEIVLTEATHSHSGVSKFICECGHTYTTSTPMVEHTFVYGVCECGAEMDFEPIECWNLSYGATDDVVAYLYYDGNSFDQYGEPLFFVKVVGSGRLWWNKAPWSVYRNKITSIVIDVECDGVFTIPANAFANFTELRYVKITQGLDTISQNAFRNCQKLEYVELPESVMRILPMAFKDCKNLVTVNGLKHVAEIGDYAFENCTNLVEINGLEELCFVGARAFRQCRSLRSIVLGRGVRELRPYIFEGCVNLETVTILGSIYEIPDRTFFKCERLWSVVIDNEVPLERIGVSAFEACKSLKYVAITGGVVEIQKQAFLNCYQLMGINLGDCLKTIGERAFCGCVNLIELRLPETVSAIGASAFLNCNNLTIYTAPEFHDVYMVQNGGYKKQVVERCTHTHFWDEGEDFEPCDGHCHDKYYSDKIPVVIEDHFNDGMYILACSCGATIVKFEPRLEEHKFNPAEKVNKVSHISYCNCGESQVAEHNFVESVCQDCGYEKKNVLEREDIDFMGIAVPDGEVVPDEYIGDTEQLFDGETIHTGNGVNFGGFSKAMLGFNFYVSTADINGIIIYSDAALGENARYEIAESYDGASILTIYVTIIEPGNGEANPYFFEIGGDMDFSKLEIIIENELVDYHSEAVFTEIQFSLGIRELNVELDKETGDTTVSKDEDLYEDPNTVTITLSPGDIEWIKNNSTGNGNGKLVVSTKFGEVKFNREAVEKICEASKGIIVSISRSIDERGRIKYSISVSDLDGNALLPHEDSDKNGNISVHIKFKAGKKQVNLKVEFHGENKTDEMKVTGYDDKSGVLSFDTTHFSDYVIYDSSEDMSYLVDNLFTSKGYSTCETTNAICIGFTIDYEAVAEYEEFMETKLDFGVLFASKELLGDKQPLDENGNTVKLDTGMVIKTSLAGYSYTSYEFKLQDLTEDLFDHSFVVSGYAITNGGAVYYQDGGMSKEVTGVSYKEVKEMENQEDEEIYEPTV